MCVPLLQVCRPLRTVQSWSLRGVASRALVDYGLNLQMGGGGSEWSGTRPRPHSQWRQNLHQVTPAIDCAFPSQAGRVMKWVLASSFSPLRLLLALLLSLVNEDKVADSGVRGRASICPKPF